MADNGRNTTSIFRFFDQKYSYGALLFFCISGFLMALLIEQGYRNFFVRRMLRIYPTYIVAVGMAIFLKLILFDSITQTSFLKSLTLLPFGGIQYTLNIEWTLVYEVFFYIVCTLFTVGSLRKLYFPFLILWAAIILISSFQFHVQTLFLPTPSLIIFSIFNLYFILGGIAYQIHKKLKSGNLLSLSIVVVAILSIPVYEKASEHFNLSSQVHMAVLSLLFFIIILFGSKVNLKNTKVTNFLVSYGDYSYGLYLIHVTIITSLLAYIYSKLNSPVSSVISLLVLIISLLCGWYFGKLDIKLYRLLKLKTKN